MKQFTFVQGVLPVTAILLSYPVLGLADGGVVTKASGSVVAIHNSEKLPVTVGSALQGGDALVTGESGAAQLRFDDSSVFALTKGSQLAVDTFRMPRAGNPGVAAYSLKQGGIRTITGSIGKGKGDQYVVRVPGGDIKVQGTAYLALVCAGNCPGFKDGTYVRTEKGIVFFANAKGGVKLRVGQTAYVGADGSAPVFVKVSPFDDPKVAAEFKVKLNADLMGNPPRIEPEPAASPS
jgi:hypothetical protein